MNPALADDVSVKATVAVGCSLVRAALGSSVAISFRDSSDLYRQEKLFSDLE